MSTNANEMARIPGSRFVEPDDVFQLKVRLLEVEPPVWRRIRVAQDVRLPRLHAILQVVMGWTNSHLHQFMLGDVTFGEPDDEFDSSPIDYRRIQLNQIAPRIGSTFIYEYDFGDGWQHLIEVEDALPVVSVKEALPLCLDGERACPPEDVGGPHGYATFLAAWNNPDDPEHEEWRVWAGDGFDPSAFDLGSVNRLLAGYAAPRPARSRRPRQSGRS